MPANTGIQCSVIAKFSAGCEREPVDLDRLKGAWRTLSDKRLGEYRQALPAAWADGFAVADDALGYIAEIRDNIDSALAEVGRILQ